MCEISQSYLTFFKQKVSRKTLGLTLEFLLSEMRESKRYSSKEMEALHTSINYVWMLPEDGEFDTLSLIDQNFEYHMRYLKLMTRIHNERPPKTYGQYGEVMDMYIEFIYDISMHAHQLLGRFTCLLTRDA